jgi:hypothetical protein
MIEQIFIVIFGLGSIWMTNDPRETVRRWACVAGLMAQPFWFYSAWKAGQWGIFALAFAYTAGWLRGFRHYWMDRA